MVTKENIKTCSAVLGIDPGIGRDFPGAAVLWNARGELRLHDWQGEIQASDFLDECAEYHIIDLAIIEKQWSWPGYSVTLMDKLIGNYHFWRGLLVSRRIPFLARAHKSWQKGLPLNFKIKDTKQRSLSFVWSLFSEDFCKKYFNYQKNHGRADATIMAYSAQLFLNKEFKRP